MLTRDKTFTISELSSASILALYTEAVLQQFKRLHGKLTCTFIAGPPKGP